jgi:membrane-associated phospholipid phosphatase
MKLRSDVPQRLLPDRFRRSAIVIICASAVVTAALGVMFAHHTTGSSFDNTVQRVLNGNGNGNFGPGFRPGPRSGPRQLLQVFSLLGSTPVLAMVTVLLVYCSAGLRRYRGALLLASSVIIGSGLSELVLKPIVDRTRYGTLSYPSGHATAAFALATAIIILLVRPPDARMPVSMRIVISCLTAAAACGIAVGLTVHYFTDTIGGAGVGIAVTLLIALLLDRFDILAAQAEVPVRQQAESAPVS